MKKVVLFIVLLLSICFVHGKSFSRLSSFDPVSTVYHSEVEGYQNIHLLMVNDNKLYDSIPLELTIEIGGERMTDYLTLGSSLNDIIKTIFLFEGDSARIELRILSSDSIIIENVNGNLTFKNPLVIKSNGSSSYKTFIGGYWDVKQPLMFHLNYSDSSSHFVKFSIEFGPNYEFDHFFYQVNVIKPDASFISLEGILEVNTTPFLSLKTAKFDLLQKVNLEQPGKYVIEFIPLMNRQRINGISAIEYQLEENKKI